MAGRRIKAEYPRTEFLKIRISPQHKDLINRITDEFQSTIVSQADIVERAVEAYGQQFVVFIDPDVQ